MAGAPVHAHPQRALALVAGDDAHQGRLAHEAAQRLDRGPAQPRDQVADADAADLLVVGDREMDRADEPPCRHVGHRREATGEEALHVGSAAAEEPAVAARQLERIARPGLPVCWDHVGMPGQDIARRFGGPDGRPDIRLGPGGVGDALMGDAEAVEIALDPRDQRKVRVPAGRVEADKGLENVDRSLDVRHGALRFDTA